jgi:hypothetical protein
MERGALIKAGKWGTKIISTDGRHVDTVEDDELAFAIILGVFPRSAQKKDSTSLSQPETD